MVRAILANGATGATIRAALNVGRPFSVAATLTATGAGTPVHVVAAASVGAAEKIYITGLLFSVSGSTAWSGGTGTLVRLQDTAGTPVVGATVAAANLLANAKLGLTSLEVVLAAPILAGTGFTAAKGLDIAGDNNFGAGSDIIATVTGYIA